MCVVGNKSADETCQVFSAEVLFLQQLQYLIKISQ